MSTIRLLAIAALMAICEFAAGYAFCYATRAPNPQLCYRIWRTSAQVSYPICTPTIERGT
jgi:hypothetical protein